jgi:UDP-N-acetyl-D-mannosaminuronate dehydrogenase
VSHGRKIAVIGLGYVGLPVAVAFARSGVPVIGFDINPRRIKELRSVHDRTREVDTGELANRMLRLENDPVYLKEADFLLSLCRRRSTMHTNPISARYFRPRKRWQTRCAKVRSSSTIHGLSGRG